MGNAAISSTLFSSRKVHNADPNSVLVRLLSKFIVALWCG
ncbi:hypothetical protein HMPREF9997_02529 [Corynebacterium durum F0235]|uniref:Uncharacterized protein n=1 Tax=Corynebacterium durum F0235 TaxID=1035195 RepID=L1M965_9CORY|nr:hypothetical protein HMPREF9997_02529 [Corynebacterium durum F0235]